jgi:hypothetical protein
LQLGVLAAGIGLSLALHGFVAVARIQPHDLEVAFGRLNQPTAARERARRPQAE